VHEEGRRREGGRERERERERRGERERTEQVLTRKHEVFE